MALKPTSLNAVSKHIASGFDDPNGNDEDLRTVLKQLRGLKQTVVNGATQGTAITVTGIATDDHLISVVRLTVTGTAANFAEEVAGYTISTAGSILGNSTNGASNSTGERLLVTYYDFSAGA